ncbi:MAG TPA: AraC family transcriptional regulator ligand-binding domain-containing protein [Pyrinomonadaceae bacterium]
MTKATVTAGLPKAFLDFAASRGADRRMLLQRSTISLNEILDPDNRIPLTSYVALLMAGIELCHEPALALLFGEAVKLQDISIVGLLGEVAETCQSGQQLLNRYAPLLIDDGHDRTADFVEFVPDDGRIWMKFTSSVYVDHPVLTESGFARCVCTARGIFESNGIQMEMPFPEAIHFAHSQPDYRAEYDRIFGVPLFFDSHMNAMLVDKKYLSVTTATNAYLSQLVTRHADEMLRRLTHSKSFRGHVEHILIRILHTGEATIGQVAKELGLSRQTLFRKLKAEGITFQQVLDELRHKLALEYLSNQKTSTEVAYLLGFSDQAAFSRAFKRWTGSRPSKVAKTNAGSVH